MLGCLCSLVGPDISAKHWPHYVSPGPGPGPGPNISKLSKLDPDIGYIMLVQTFPDPYP